MTQGVLRASLTTRALDCQQGAPKTVRDIASLSERSGFLRSVSAEVLQSSGGLAMNTTVPEFGAPAVLVARTGTPKHVNRDKPLAACQ